MGELRRTALFPSHSSQAPAVRFVKRKLSKQKIWYFNRYQDIQFILSNRSDFTAHTISSNGLEQAWDWLRNRFSPVDESLVKYDPPHHSRLRNIISDAFTPRSIKALQAGVQRIVNETLDGLPGSSTVDIVREFAQPIPSRVIIEILGLPKNFESAFLHLTRAYEQPQNKLLGFRAFHSFARHSRKTYLERYSDPGDGLLSRIVQSEKAGLITRPEAVEMLNVLLIAGYITTASFLSTSILVFLLQPENQSRARRKEGLESTEIEELLRFSSVLNSPRARWAIRDIEVGDVLVRKNDAVIVEITNGNLDPGIFVDPEWINLDRSPNRHLAFGLGVHSCIGASLARMEGRVALNALFRRFPNMSLACDLESIPTLDSPLNISAITQMPVNLGQEN